MRELTRNRRWLTLIILHLLFIFSATVSANITGTIFRDFNLNGTKDALEPGVENIIITAYDDTGAVVATGTSIAGGIYDLATTAGKFRVEVTGIPSFLKPGTAIGGSTQALVSIIDDGVTHDVSLNNAGEYCQADPEIIMTRFAKGAHTGANHDLNTILQHKYTDNGTDAPTNISTYSEVGSVYGLAHLRKSNVTYVSTYFKRHTDIGTGGIGAIYKVDHTTGNAVSTFVTLPGTDPRNANAGYDWNHDPNGYAGVGKTGIGDIELSDDESKLFAVNMDDKKLYIINVDANGDAESNTSHPIPIPCENAQDFRPMALGFRDGTLYVGATCTAESTVTINDPDDSYDGPRKGNSHKLSAHVYRFDPVSSSFNTTPVLDIPLDYGRGCAFHGDISNANPPADCAQIADHDGILRPFIANWLPWQMDFDIVFNDKLPGNVGRQDAFLEYPQPLLSDIEFDNDGSMIIQIKDINGDRTGHANHSPNLADVDVHNGNSYGDIIRACGNLLAGWTLESNGQCGGITTGGANKGEGLGGGEYYWYDNGPGGVGNINGQTSGHPETTMGGLLHIAGYPDIITGVMDVQGTSGIDNGLMWLQNSGSNAGQISTDAGGIPKRLLVSRDDGTIFFGKASGIGDIEVLCDAAPIEIGNYVWNDANNNGIQDPSEAKLSDVKVELYEGATLVGTATTVNGEYFFGGSANTNMAGDNPLKRLKPYQLRIDLTDAALGGMKPTQQNINANTDDLHDSDGDNEILNPGFSTVAHTTGGAGANDHTLDFGFFISTPIVNTVSIGSIVWNDSNANGSQDAGEPGISGALVKLLDGTGTPVTGVSTQTTGTSGLYFFNNLPAGDYKIEVTMPAGFVPTINQDIADNNDVQNDSNIASSAANVYTSGKFTLTDNGEPSVDSNITGSDNADSADENNGNMTVDFGFIPGTTPVITPVVSIGSIIWNDSNANGSQDTGEPGISGAIVKLLDGTGAPVTGVSTQTTGTNGLYFFNNLPTGDYKVEMTMPVGFIPTINQNTSDNNDAQNDSNIATSAANMHTSGIFTLADNGEPNALNSNITGSDDADNADEDNGNMTVDFGFTQETTPVVPSSSSPKPIPTLSEWGHIILIMLLGMIAVIQQRHRRKKIIDI